MCENQKYISLVVHSGVGSFFSLSLGIMVIKSKERSVITYTPADILVGIQSNLIVNYNYSYLLSNVEFKTMFTS